ncbi:hypothetical protein FOXG_02524 [Fusarium oxysporum f. sp. lycopersici 4287]|uniref:FAD-binding PCMH-type domain-containing protein n=2 Tax=Fusarium oxysporum TaxID=5507 RepID=A0A0J9UFA5_FUSO4|nr:hypothetical protein FOXG_02524 [Fusarium oxysporum f. sp. lycopersici 4287]KNA98088.1 hypothetical protein FOXG_02524 [Fusarium oxysporum f. sp. lycopersici 4287]
MVINDEDHDVEELIEEDFPEEAPETVQYIISQVKLSKAMRIKLLFAKHEADSISYYLINLSQRLQRQCNTSKEVKPVLDAAAQIFSLVENSLLFWTPEHFPMIYVSALFSAMMALAVDVKTSAPKSDQIFVKIRPGLLALKQFESVYILARWIKNFFMDILNRPPPTDTEEAQRPPTNSNSDDVYGGGTGTEMRNSSADQVYDIQKNTASAGQATHDATGFEDSNFAFDQSSGFEGGGCHVGSGQIVTPDSTCWATSNVFPDSITSSVPSSLFDTPEIQHDLSASNIEGACKEFAAILGPENVSTERTDLVTHSGSDYQSYAWTEESAILSQVILYPETTEQVSELMKGICIDFGRMNNIVELNKYDLDCVVQPGIGWMDLNEELAAHGLFFPPDPGPGAMIGGMVGTGCSGTNAAAYGTMKDWVLSLTVVLADGTIIKTRQRARKSSAGYDLTRTFIGSEGTLGLVTEATLKLAVKPPCEAVAVCTFPTLRDAASAVREVLSNGIQVAAVEILDEVQMKSINDSALTRLKWKEEPTLFFKFTGSDEFIVDHLAKQVGSITKQNRSTAYKFASDETERNELWSARKNALWSMLAMRKSPTDKVWTTDVAVPLSRLPDIIEFAKADIEKSGLLGSIVGHVGDGNFHTLLLFPEDKRYIAEEVVHRMVDKAIEMKGTATGEHGVGLVKRDYLEKELGKEAVDTMRSVVRMQAA